MEHPTATRMGCPGRPVSRAPALQPATTATVLLQHYYSTATAATAATAATPTRECGQGFAHLAAVADENTHASWARLVDGHAA
eukprot:2074783-Prymnesium_polylepis.1